LGNPPLGGGGDSKNLPTLQNRPGFVKCINCCRVDLDFLQKNVDDKVIERLEHVGSTAFTRITYTEAVEILTDAIRSKKKKFENSTVTFLESL